MSYNKLAYRRQFLFTNAKIVNREKWHQEHISAYGEKFSLISHGDLNIESDRNRIHVILLGYLLDPFNPTSSNKDIVREMAGCRDYREVISRTHALNGRFVLIILDKDKVYLLNDATASKQVYYLFENDEFWIASTPNLISEFKNLEASGNSEMLQYLNSPEYRNRDSAWFGSETPYKGVYALSPNHLINIGNRTSERFWPVGKAEKRSLHESVAHVATLLKGTIESAALRYKLHISLTGGWDSRMILSASRGICGNAEYYTLKSPANYERNISDYLIPEKIVNEYKLNYGLIELDGSSLDGEFMDTYVSNSVFNRNIYAEVYYRYISLDYEDRMNVTGVMGDQLLRAFYRFNGETTAEKIAQKFNVSGYSYILSSIADFLKYTEPLAEDMGIHMIDWFNWEYFSANWAGISATEHDIARDELRMFNCRELIKTYMQIPEKFRYRDNPMAHKLVIKENWPELLDIGIEPSNIQYRKLKKILRFLAMERRVENLYSRLKA